MHRPDMPLGRSGVQQENKKENGVKTEYSVPAAPGDDVMHRLDVELGRSGAQQTNKQERSHA